MNATAQIIWGSYLSLKKIWNKKAEIKLFVLLKTEFKQHKWHPTHFLIMVSIISKVEGE